FVLPAQLAAPTPSVLHTLSLHDALPISRRKAWSAPRLLASACSARRTSSVRRAPRAAARFVPSPTANRSRVTRGSGSSPSGRTRSEEHTSELQSPYDLVCRLLLEKKTAR